MSARASRADWRARPRVLLQQCFAQNELFKNRLGVTDLLRP